MIKVKSTLASSRIDFQDESVRRLDGMLADAKHQIESCMTKLEQLRTTNPSIGIREVMNLLHYELVQLGWDDTKTAAVKIPKSQTVSDRDVMRKLRGKGLTEKILKKNGVEIYKTSQNDFFFSIGDWAKAGIEDKIESAIKDVFPKADVTWEYEGGPGSGNWKKIF